MSSRQVFELLARESSLMRDRMLLAKEVEFLRQQMLERHDAEAMRFQSTQKALVDEILVSVSSEEQAKLRERVSEMEREAQRMVATEQELLKDLDDLTANDGASDELGSNNNMA